MKSLARIILFIILFSGTSFAGDVTYAPTLMPNFPMLAGENVMIMWVPVPGAVKYNIYQNGKFIGESPAPPFTHTAPTEPGEYKYKVSGVDGSGAEGPVSRESNLEVSDLVQPSGFSARFLGEILNIRWDKVQDAVIYDIYRAENKDGPYKMITSITETRYVDADIRQKEEFFEKTFYYKIVSRDKFNESSPDTEFHAYYIKRSPPPTHDQRMTIRIQRSKEVAFVRPAGLQSCYDAAFLSDGESLVYADTFARKVAVIDSAGNELRTIGSAGPRPDQYSEPIRLAVDENDDIYIIDNKKPKIFVYGSDGNSKSSFDFHLIDEKEVLDIHDYLNKPVTPKLNAILVKGDLIYAADKVTGTIQIYNKNSGDFIDYFKDTKKKEILYFGALNKMLHGEGSKLYIARPIVRRIEAVNIKSGETLRYFGDEPYDGSLSFFYGFGSINGMVFDKRGDLIVSDGGNHTVQAYDAKQFYKTGEETYGMYKHHLGGEKAAIKRRGRGLYQPLNASLDYAGSVNIDKNGRLWIYLGKDKGFTVREYIGDDIWDARKDDPDL